MPRPPPLPLHNPPYTTSPSLCPAPLPMPNICHMPIHIKDIWLHLLFTTASIACIQQISVQLLLAANSSMLLECNFIIMGETDNGLNVCYCRIIHNLKDVTYWDSTNSHGTKYEQIPCSHHVVMSKDGEIDRLTDKLMGWMSSYNLAFHCCGKQGIIIMDAH